MAKQTTLPAATVSIDRARAMWFDRQRLCAPAASPVKAVEQSGYVRTLGGTDAHLALFARTKGLTAKKVAGAVTRRTLQVVPAVRGCIYLVPKADVPLLLRNAEAGYRKRTERDIVKAGATTKEVDEVCAGVIEELGKDALTTHGLRKALPDGLLRSLGPKGKKVGMSSTLPVALRYLELEGRVERVPESLDTEKYAWRIPAEDPFAGISVPDDPLDRLAALWDRFLRWAGPARLDDFVGWAACGKRDAKAALERLPAVPVAVEGLCDEAWLLEADLGKLRKKSRATGLAFLPFEDNLHALHGGPGPLTDPAHHEVEVQQWGRSCVAPLGSVRYIHCRALVDGGKLVGFWEFDPDSGEIVAGTFDGKRPKGLAAEAKRVAAFLADVGHGRAYSLDTDDALRARVEEIRKM